MTNIASNETAYPHRGGIFDLQYQAAWDTGNDEQEGETRVISSVRFSQVTKQMAPVEWASLRVKGTESGFSG